MALKLDVLANTRQFVGEMKQAGASVENISDELDDMAREGKEAGDKLERSFRDSVREAKKLDDGIKDVGRSSKRSFDDAEDGVKEFGRESQSTLRETAASISSVEDGLGAVQEIAANAFVGFGPVGAGAGLVAALGFGLLLENINAQAEAAEALKESFRDAYRTAAEEGRAFIDEAQIQAIELEIRFDPVKRKQAEADAKALGTTYENIVRAQAGDQEALNAVIQAGNDKLAVAVEDTIERGAAARDTLDVEVLQDQALKGIIGKYEGIRTLQDEEQEAAEKYLDSTKRRGEAERIEIQKTHDAGMRLFDMFNERAKAPYTALIQVAADTSKYDAAVRKLQQQSLTKTVIVRPGGPVLYN